MTAVTRTLTDLVKEHVARQSSQGLNRSLALWPEPDRTANSPGRPRVPSGGYTPGLRGRIRSNGIFLSLVLSFFFQLKNGKETKKDILR